MSDLISVIVPVYKVEEVLLRKSLESILKQTHFNIELLVVDDGSPDNCGKYVMNMLVSTKGCMFFISIIMVFHLLEILLWTGQKGVMCIL